MYLPQPAIDDEVKSKIAKKRELLETKKATEEILSAFADTIDVAGLLKVFEEKSPRTKGGGVLAPPGRGGAAGSAAAPPPPAQSSSFKGKHVPLPMSKGGPLPLPTGKGGNTSSTEATKTLSDIRAVGQNLQPSPQALAQLEEKGVVMAAKGRATADVHLTQRGCLLLHKGNMLAKGAMTIAEAAAFSGPSWSSSGGKPSSNAGGKGPPLPGGKAGGKIPGKGKVDLVITAKQEAAIQGLLAVARRKGGGGVGTDPRLAGAPGGKGGSAPGSSVLQEGMPSPVLAPKGFVIPGKKAAAPLDGSHLAGKSRTPGLFMGVANAPDKGSSSPPPADETNLSSRPELRNAILGPPLKKQKLENTGDPNASWVIENGQYVRAGPGLAGGPGGGAPGGGAPERGLIGRENVGGGKGHVPLATTADEDGPQDDTHKEDGWWHQKEQLSRQKFYDQKRQEWMRRVKGWPGEKNEEDVPPQPAAFAAQTSRQAGEEPHNVVEGGAVSSSSQQPGAQTTSAEVDQAGEDGVPKQVVSKKDFEKFKKKNAPRHHELNKFKRHFQTIND